MEDGKRGRGREKRGREEGGGGGGEKQRERLVVVGGGGVRKEMRGGRIAREREKGERREAVKERDTDTEYGYGNFIQ